MPYTLRAVGDRTGGYLMADILDRAAEREQEERDGALASVRAAAAAMPKGEPGECESCGEHFARIVNGQCGFCRDGRYVR